MKNFKDVVNKQTFLKCLKFVKHGKQAEFESNLNHNFYKTHILHNGSQEYTVDIKNSLIDDLAALENKINYPGMIQHP